MSERHGVLAAVASSALGGTAAAFYLGVFALERSTPTRVANTGAGIWMASTVRQ